MGSSKALLLFPPIAYTSEANSALGFSKVLGEYGISKQYGIFFIQKNFSLDKMRTDLLSSVKKTWIRLFKGSLISAPLDYLILKLNQTINHVDILLNLYYTEIPIGLDLNYVIYPPDILAERQRVKQGYERPIKRVYFDLNEKIIDRISTPKKTLCSSFYIKDIVKRTIGIDCDVIYPPILKEIKDIPFNQKTNLVIGIGKYVPSKHWEEFIEVAKIVKKRMNDVKFVIIGGLENAFSSMEYFRKIKSLSEDSVTLLTDVNEDEKWRLLSQAKVILHCMRHDNVSLGVAEAMYSGAVPVMFRSTGSWTDISLKGKYGFTYQSVDEASKYIIDLIENNEIFKNNSLMVRERSMDFAYSTFKGKVFNVIDEFFGKR
ncbi:glycosyltransferase [Acidianus sp. RZ1]|uniref:glycosyltransferase n=1 Tax=Acidianus sp. RZ1 TaxID=1540082 RepID=UPI001490980A|nr:glycosyltransferase [Acidianus sp. RZ1]NON61713.1 glycosyltransferase [Acidianus sp. RZ1]